jgi:hypothetical protein
LINNLRVENFKEKNLSQNLYYGNSNINHNKNHNSYGKSNDNFLLNKKRKGNLIKSSIFPGYAREFKMEEIKNNNRNNININNNNISHKNNININDNIVNNNNFNNKNNININNNNFNNKNNINTNNNNFNNNIHEKIPKKRGRKKKVQIQENSSSEELSEKDDSEFVVSSVEKDSSISQSEDDSDFEGKKNYKKKNNSLNKIGGKNKLKSKIEDEKNINNTFNEKFINDNQVLDKNRKIKYNKKNENDCIENLETSIEKGIKEKNSSNNNNTFKEIFKLFNNDKDSEKYSDEYIEKAKAKKIKQMLQLLNSEINNNNNYTTLNENHKGNSFISNDAMLEQNIGNYFKFF